MIQVKLSGADTLQKKFAEYGKAVDREAGSIIRDIAAQGAKNLATNTFPKGTDSKVKDTLTKAVQKDLHKVYFPSRTSHETDSGAYLESRRNNKGRVSKREKQMFVSTTNFDQIQKAKLKTIGEAKAGWLAAAKDLRTAKRSMIPAWLRKPVERGYNIVTAQSVVLVNTVRYASSVIRTADIQKSIGYAYKNYINFINRRMAALTKK